MEKIHYQDKVIVLMYHYIAPDEATVSNRMISLNRLINHLDALHVHGYNVISIEQYLQFVRQKEDVPPNAVVLTFDDGCQSFYTYVYPELKKRGIPATNFFVVRFADGFDPNDKLTHLSYPVLSWDQMRQMKQDGLSFYSHTYDQHRLIKTSNNGDEKHALVNIAYLGQEDRFETQKEYETRISTDLKLADKRIQDELGDQPKILCYPYGRYNDTVIAIGKELGIELFFTIQEGINYRNEIQARRLNAGSPQISADHLIEKIRLYHEN